MTDFIPDSLGLVTDADAAPDPSFAPKPNMSISVLGSTGSIGTQTLEVALQRNYHVQALAVGRNLDVLAQQIQQHQPQVVSVHESVYAEALTRFSGSGTRIISNLTEVAALKVDVLVNAISGLAGLAPTRVALEAGQAVALATKEAMVTAAHLMWDAAQKGGGRVVPIDSEHTGVYQCLLGEQIAEVSELILTASGGPFRTYQGSLSEVTPAQALKHPSWVMGPKVTIDSATLMNKGLEVMECASLYGLPLERVRVVVHPQSIIHAAVRFRDGSLKAQFGPPDMRLPIAYAIDAAPQGMRYAGDVGSAKRGTEIGEHLAWPMLGTWDFFAPEIERFPCLNLAYRAGEMGGVAGVALNAADEIAVTAFLAEKIGFLDIPRLISIILDETPKQTLTWENLYEVDIWARTRTTELVTQ